LWKEEGRKKEEERRDSCGAREIAPHFFCVVASETVFMALKRCHDPSTTRPLKCAGSPVGMTTGERAKFENRKLKFGNTKKAGKMPALPEIAKDWGVGAEKPADRE
jgi:hypothetical protein